MENKKYIILLCIVIFICFGFVGYFNYDKIIKFFNDKEWEFAESYATIKLENINQVEAGKTLFVLTDNELQMYGNDAKLEYTEKMKISEIISNSCEDYTAIARNDTNQIYLFKDKQLVWTNKLSWEINNVSVNKNGYVIVIYSQNSKSSIKILKPSGEELFTTYLGSTYALDVEMSNDNKYLYIAEVDTEGIKIKSNIKIIEVADVNNGNLSPKVETLLVGTDTIITDIEYSDSNNLLIMRDNGVSVLEKGEVKSIIDFEVKNTLFSSVENINKPVYIEKVSTGIFTNETNLKIYQSPENITVAKIEKTPQSIDTLNNVIALNLGDEVLFLNMDGKVVKRYELENQLLKVKLFNNASQAALVFRNRIELIKL